MSEIKVNKISPRSGTAFTLGDSGDTFTVPSGATLTTTDATVNLPVEIKTNKISPVTGTAFTFGDSGDTFTVPAGATITNSGTATGFGGGKILQVVQTTKTDTFTSGSSNAWIDVTGLTADITPSAASSKVLVQLTIGACSIGSANSFGFKLVRGSTDISVGAAGGSRIQASIWNYDGSSNRSQSEACIFLDTPNTTSATTYKVQMYANATAYLNRMSSDNDNDTYGRTASSITLIEVGA